MITYMKAMRGIVYVKRQEKRMRDNLYLGGKPKIMQPFIFLHDKSTSTSKHTIYKGHSTEGRLFLPPLTCKMGCQFPCA